MDQLDKTQDNLATQREWADRLSLPMFALALVFLLLLAAIIVSWVDIPRVAELAALEAEAGEVNLDNLEQHVSGDTLALLVQAQKAGRLFGLALLAIWPLFWLEFLFNLHLRNWRAAGIKSLIHPLLVCLVPPLRLGAIAPAWGNRMWLPALSWQHTGTELVRLLERFFSKPMLVIALLILPVLLLEFVFKSYVDEHFWLRFTLHACTGFIWFAFAFEFIIMVSASDKKLAYIKKNWIDLAIILLPLISFLRTLRILRLAKLSQVQKIAKLGRIYRMRGLGMKALRALMLFEVINRLMRITPEKQLVKLRTQLDEREQEIAELKARIDEIEQELKNCPPDD